MVYLSTGQPRRFSILRGYPNLRKINERPDFRIITARGGKASGLNKRLGSIKRHMAYGHNVKPENLDFYLSKVNRLDLYMTELKKMLRHSMEEGMVCGRCFPSVVNDFNRLAWQVPKNTAYNPKLDYNMKVETCQGCQLIAIKKGNTYCMECQRKRLSKGEK